MCSTHYGRLTKRLVYSSEKLSLSIRAEEGAERVAEGAAERDDIFLQVNDYKVSKEVLEHELLEPDVTLKAPKVSVMHME